MNTAKTLKCLLYVSIYIVLLTGLSLAKEKSDSTMSGTANTKLSASEFVTKMAESDKYEVSTAQLALKNSTNPEVKAFAQKMETDHSKSTSDLKAAISSSGRTDLKMPETLPTKKQTELDNLSAMTGTNFDKAYIDDQVKAHKKALAILNMYSQQGDVPSLKDFAKNTAPIVQQHLEAAKSLQRKLGSSGL